MPPMSSPPQPAGDAASAEALRAERLVAGYDRFIALDDVTLRIPHGCLVGVLGPNGSGKSTLLRVFVGLLEPRAGQVSVLGLEPRRARSRVGYVPQLHGERQAFPITVGEVVAMGLYRWGRWLDRGRERQQRVRRALARVGLEEAASRPIHTLSGGQQRRVLIARALVREPELLLLDEPTAGLDAPAEEALLLLLRQLADEGRTVVVATHDLASVRDAFDLAVLLNRRVIAAGPPVEVMVPDLLDATFGRELLHLHGAPRHHVRHHAGERR